MNNELHDLLKKHLEGNISTQESVVLENLINLTDSQELEETLFQVIEESKLKVDQGDVDVNSVNFYDIYRKIVDQDKEVKLPAKQNNIVLTLKYVISIASVFVLAFFLFRNSHKSPTEVQVLNDINPAQSIANITLASGKVLTIDSARTGLVYKEDGLSVYRSEDGVIKYALDSTSVYVEEYITVSTPKGGFTKLTLADGTIAALNSASTLKYPVAFKNNNREIFAEGEIFFDVAKDKNRPFRIFSDKQTIEVLGTSFNLHTNKGEAKTTLIEGSVKILVDNKSYILKPGQQSIVNNSVEIRDTKVQEEVAWTNDQFLFDNGSFLEILKEIENWYDVKFVFERRDIVNVKLSGSLSRKVKLSELLKVLAINTGYTYEIQERRVIVK